MTALEDLSTEEVKTVFTQERILLLQQILASDNGVRSVPELEYLNPEMSESSIYYHLETLADHDIVTRVRLPEDERESDLPYVFWAVTPLGIELLQDSPFFDTLGLLYQVYDAVEYPPRQQAIQELDPPTPDWYDMLGPESTTGDAQYDDANA